jgi:predicted metal-dependent RNase
MAVMTVEEFGNWMDKLPKELQFASKEILMEIAKDLQKRIRLRAPRGGSGTLKQIEIKKTRKDDLAIYAPKHWEVVDLGLKPNSEYIPISLIQAHLNNPGSTVGKKAKQLGLYDEPIGFIKSQIPRGKGFVSNSIKSSKGNINKLIEIGVAKALAK